MNIYREKSVDNNKGVYVKRSSKIFLNLEKQKLGIVDQNKIIIKKSSNYEIIKSLMKLK